MRRITHIIWHTGGVRGADSTVETIRRIHKARGWSDIGYHYSIRKSGEEQAGRPEEIAGAGVKGANAPTIHILFTGHGDYEPHTEQQREAGVNLTVRLLLKYGLHPGRVLGHRECPREFDLRDDGRSCPGKLVDMAEVRMQVADALAAARKTQLQPDRPYTGPTEV